MTESVIREMTRLALDHGAINLSQGYPDFDPPAAITEAAKRAIDGGENQYTVTWGYPPLRERLAAQYTDQLGWDVDPLRHVSVTCGVTEGLCAAPAGDARPRRRGARARARPRQLPPGLLPRRRRAGGGPARTGRPPRRASAWRRR